MGITGKNFDMLSELGGQLDPGRAAAHNYDVEIGAGVNSLEDPAAETIAECISFTDVVDEVAILSNTWCSEVIGAAADRQDQRVVWNGPTGKCFCGVRQRNRAELYHLAATIQARKFARPVSQAAALGVRNEADILDGIVRSACCECVQHGFPDMRTIVIDKQDFSGLTSCEVTAQVRRGHHSRNPATHNHDTVHRFFSSRLRSPNLQHVAVACHATARPSS